MSLPYGFEIDCEDEYCMIRYEDTEFCVLCPNYKGVKKIEDKRMADFLYDVGN